MDENTAQVLNTNSRQDSFTRLKAYVNQAVLPADFKENLQEKLERIEKMISATGYRVELDREIEYIKFVSTLPFAKSSQDILDLHRTAEVLNKNHHGLSGVKERILEYLSMLILNSRKGTPLKASVLAFVGLVGTGKTTMAYSIAESLGRHLIRIPFGGLGSVAELRGESRVRAEAEPGLLLKAIHSAGVNNPVVLLDEVDRVSTEARADVMGVLVELLDPEQNFAFLDHYVSYPFDLSKVLFIATANNTGNIATAVMDRLELIEMPSYDDKEKVTIGRDYILPRVIKEAGLEVGTLSIEEDAWPQIVRPLGYDSGIRSLHRTIEAIVRKIAREVVEGKQGPFKVNTTNLNNYISVINI